MTDAIFQAESFQTSRCEDDACVLAFIEFLQTRVKIAAQGFYF